MTKASDLFVKALAAEGVSCVFGLPGEENLDLLESLRTSTIRLVVTRHEQAAGFMAATWGRLTGRAGVCLSTLGPGATNFVTAAAYAQLGGMPMLMITGQKPIKTSKQGHFQIVDVVDMMRPLTKYTRSIVAADAIPGRVREAFRVAQQERPGAVHLELPEDVAHESSDAEPIPASYDWRPVADEKSIARAVEAIEHAHRPLVMVGAGANRKLTSRMLRALVDRVGLPFLSTQMGKGVVDETHPLWLGTAALSAGNFVHSAIEACDCIVNVGHDVIEKPPFVMHGPKPTVIHLNFLSAEVDPVYFPQIEVIGDIANAVWRISEQVTPQPHWDFTYFDRVRMALADHLARGADYLRFPMFPPRVVAEVRRAVPDDGIVCLDNGMYKLCVFALVLHEPPAEHAPPRQRPGDDGRGAAVGDRGEARAPEAEGDGRVRRRGFLMNSQELETAVRLGLDLTILVVRDDAYGMIRWKQAEMGMANFGMSFGNPDFVRLAEAYGARTAIARRAPQSSGLRSRDASRRAAST